MVADWKLKSTKPLHDYRIFRTRSDTRVSPRTGKEHEFYVLESPDWVNIVAVTDSQEIVLINQFRHGICGTVLEIPGGMIDDGEEPKLSAQRELLEETGYTSNEFIEIGKVHPNPALFDNICYTFLAKSAKKIREPEFEGTEDIETILYPSKDIMEL
ncbi:MAG: NUDIX hydrolase, partial [Thermodesulfobacteriota bacterium]